MVCVASEGQGALEIWDLVEGGDEPVKKTVKLSPSVRVAELVSRICHVHHYKIGSVRLILQWDGNKVDLTHVRQDRTIAEIGVDFASGSTYRLLITELLSSPSESDEQKMPCVDGSEPSVLLGVMDVTTGDFARTNVEVGPDTRVDGLFRLIERNHEPGTFGLFLRWGRNKNKLNEKDTRKLTEVGVDLSSPAQVMLLVTEPADSPTEDPLGEALAKSIRDDRTKFDASEMGTVRRTWNQRRVREISDQERIEERGQDDVEPNRRGDNGYVGLVNQAMTCYLNSLLQALYMTPEFRNALYNWEYISDPEKDEALSIPYQLQKLFLNLQTSSKNAIETTSLTKSFGWDSTQAWQQHDIQELCRVMFDALEQKFKNTEQADLINRLYEGKMMDYVKCLECGTEKSREDTFLDIPLPVRPFGSNVAYNSVEEAINAFVQPETLEGTNQYHCDTCSKKCDAHKGLKFTKFPYLLTLHLKRFDFDYSTFHRIKLNDEVTFPDVLNLNSFIPSTDNENSPCNEEDAGVAVKCEEVSTTESVQTDEKSSPCDNGMSVSDHSIKQDRDDDSGIDLSNGPSSSSCSTHNNDNDKNRSDRTESKGPYEYELFSIMIHSGSASGGHYYAYIKDFRTGEWLCFNDQNVSPITEDDIQKTYGGGPTRAYYSGVYSSSTNAYMLMYRQIDPVRNALPMQVADFPKHLRELLSEMQIDQDKSYRDCTSNEYKLTVFWNYPNEKTFEITCPSDQTWADFTTRVHRKCLGNSVPRDQVRLVTYQERSGMIECSFEGREDETVYSILDRLDVDVTRDLLLEIRGKNETFKPCLPGGEMSKVFVVDVAKKQVVKGPINVRGLITQTVGDYKLQLSEIIGMEPKDIHLIVQYLNNPSGKLISTDDSEMMHENITRGDKIFVPTTFDASTHKSIDDGIDELMKIFGSLTWFTIDLPDTSEDELFKLCIPSLAEKNKEKPVEVPLRNGPTKLSSTVNEATTSEPEKSETNEAPTTKPTATEEIPALWTETTSPPSVPNDNEEWHTPEQCNSEDSSLSYSDRTLVGEGDASEDDDYPLVSHEPAFVNYDNSFVPRTENENWDTEDTNDYYFRAEVRGEKTLMILVDRRMSVGTLKKLLEPYVGVPTRYFTIYRAPYGEMGELSELSTPLRFRSDGTTLEVKLGRVLRSDEIKVQLSQLSLEPEPEHYTNLCEWIVSKEATVAQAKKEVVAHLKKQFGIEIPLERCRLRGQDKKTLANVFLDDQKIKDCKLHWPYAIIVQELPGKEPVTDPNDVVIFTRRMPTSAGRLGPIRELVVSGKSIAEVREKISELSGIPEENLEIAGTKISFPRDLAQPVLQNSLDWSRQSTTTENGPEITLEDGIIIYYRDWREKVHESSNEAVCITSRPRRNDDLFKESQAKPRKFGIPSSSRYSPRRERALKIYIDDK